MDIYDKMFKNASLRWKIKTQLIRKTCYVGDDISNKNEVAYPMGRFRFLSMHGCCCMFHVSMVVSTWFRGSREIKEIMLRTSHGPIRQDAQNCYRAMEFKKQRFQKNVLCWWWPFKRKWNGLTNGPISKHNMNTNMQRYNVELARADLAHVMLWNAPVV